MKPDNKTHLIKTNRNLINQSIDFSKMIRHNMQHKDVRKWQKLIHITNADLVRCAQKSMDNIDDIARASRTIENLERQILAL